ncbi:MAG TPA: hypothetical protein ENL38_02840, partial [Candidatus Aminicenantes bacterium]|nr:hypothetical protein [Candidatus Aminicenantes bacterium]
MAEEREMFGDKNLTEYKIHDNLKHQIISLKMRKIISLILALVFALNSSFVFAREGIVQPKETEDAYKEALKIDKSEENYLNLLQFYRKDRQGRKYYWTLKKAVKNLPDSVVLVEKLFLRYLKKKNLDKAAELIEGLGENIEEDDKLNYMKG